MTIYVATLVGLVIMGMIFRPQTSQVGKKAYAIFAFGWLGGLAALRKYTVGNDLHYLYYSLYKRCCGTDIASFIIKNRRIEPGFLLFFKVISYISEKPQVMIIIHSLITIGIFIIFLYKHCDDLPLAVFLFVTMNHWFYCMVIMRQILAVCIALIANDVLWSKMKVGTRYLVFSLLVILAVVFHYSAFVIVVFCLLKYLKMSGKAFTLFSIISIMLFCSLNLLEWFLSIVESFLAVSGIIGKQYSYFSTQILKNARFTMTGLYGFVPYLLTFVMGGLLLIDWKYQVVYKVNRYTRDVMRRDRERRLIKSDDFTNDFLLYVILIVVLLKILAFRIPVFSRFAQYFMPYEYVIIGRITHALKYKVTRGFVLIFIYAITGVAFYMMNSNIRLNEIMTGTVPYMFFWQ